jgi:predicted amidohydrolase YtcJ
MNKADIILHNADIVTMDAMQPQARVVAISDGKVLAISKFDDLQGLRCTITKVIDCQGATILPGFHDAHCHPVGFAEAMANSDMSNPTVHSIPEIQNIIRKAAKSTPAGNWIRARGYSEFYLSEKRHPNRWDLDAATNIHPVKLTHRSGHVYVLNSLGLKLAGISVDTPDPPGGIIERDMDTGEPNGLLYEMGSFLANVIPPMSSDEIARGMRLASQQFVSLGITSVQDASARNNVQRWETLKHWKSSGIFKPRITMMIGSEALHLFQDSGFKPGSGDDQINIGAVKIIVHRATGLITPTQDELNEKVMLAHQSGFQMAIHAMEEITVETALLALENALSKFPRKNHRHRIEHCSICKPEMAKRLARLGTVVVTQPSFIYYNGERYLKTISADEIVHLYPMSTFIKAGLKVAAGSDCPVVPSNPLNGIYAAVSQIDESGKNVVTKQRITSKEAVCMYTNNAAYSCFQENIKGSITPGKLADLVILGDDPTQMSPEEIKKIEIKMTIIGGEIVWRNGL